MVRNGVPLYVEPVTVFDSVTVVVTGNPVIVAEEVGRLCVVATPDMKPTIQTTTIIAARPRILTLFKNDNSYASLLSYFQDEFMLFCSPAAGPYRNGLPLRLVNRKPKRDRLPVNIINFFQPQ